MLVMQDWMNAIRAHAPAGFTFDLVDDRTMGMSHDDGTNLDFHFPPDDDRGLEVYYLRDLDFDPGWDERMLKYPELRYEPSIGLATVEVKHYLDLTGQSAEQVADRVFKHLFRTFGDRFRRISEDLSE